MGESVLFRVLSDLVLLLHTSFVMFVVFGLVLILWGGFRGWRWVKNPWFRLVHLLTIGIVIVQTWWGILCPLTILENALRTQAGEAVYTGSFVAHWLGVFLYYKAPWWVFTLCYTVFGLAVVVGWFIVRPRLFGKSG
jgi:glucan phosphoethanolaminetransferase (alkaline phosphatase superfamily)